MNKNAVKRQQRRNKPRTTRAICPVMSGTSKKPRETGKKTVYQYKPDNFVGIEYTERFAVPTTAAETINTTGFKVIVKPTQINRKRKSAYRDTPRVKG